MKIVMNRYACTVLQVLLCLSLSAQKVTIDVTQATPESVFRTIEQQTRYTFFYKSDILVKARPVTLRLTDVPLEDALRKCFEGQPFTYSVKGRIIAVKPLSAAAEIRQQASDSFTVAGRVLLVSGEPLPGATIRIKGIDRYTITGDDGRFSLSGLREGAVLVVSGVNIETAEVQARPGFTDIVVRAKVTTSAEVIVTVNTGYQSLARARSAGSFARVEGDDIARKSGSMNVIDRVEGLVPGLAVNNSVGADKFLMRGVTSVNASRVPLFVLDGVPIENSTLNPDITRLINPDDVESITFLKDATAASIWGAQAANGVVVITSKKGRATNRRVKVNYDGFVSLRGRPDYDYLKLMSSRQLISAARQIFDPVTFSWSLVNAPVPGIGEGVVYPHELPMYDNYRGLIDDATMEHRLDSMAALDNRKDIRQYLDQPALLTNHSVSFTGGGSFHSYYGSIAYTRQQNNNKGNLDRYQLNFRQDFNFSSAVRADVTVNMSKEDTTAFIIPYLPDLASYFPYQRFADDAGHHLSQASLLRTADARGTAESLSRLNLDWVPLDEPGYASHNKSVNTTTRVNAGLMIRLVKGLQYEGRAQYLKGNGDASVFFDPRSYQVRNELVYFTQKPSTPGGAPVYYLPEKGGQYRTANTIQEAWTIRNQLIYDDSWKDHQLTALGGTEIRDSKNDIMNATVRGFDLQTLTYQGYDARTLATTGIVNPVLTRGYGNRNILGSTPMSFVEKEYRYFSFYGNVAYAYKRRYDLNASIRMDQSNLFGTDKSEQYKPIWSVGGSWLISGESFASGLKKLDLLRLRLTYGLSGNSPNPGDGGPYDILQADANPLYAQYGTAYTILTPANAHLIWERTVTTNVGVDFGLFAGRINGSIDLYRKKTTDLLGFQPLDPTAGWYEGYSNLGELSNKGVELQLRSLNIRGKDFSWTTLFNISYNRNKVVQLKKAIPLDPYAKVAGGFIEGYPAYGMFGFRWAGLDGMGDPQIYTAKGDVTKDPWSLSLDDSRYQGSTQPSWYGGITNRVTYRHFDLSFLIVYNFGYKMRRDINMLYSGRIQHNIPVSFLDRWQQPGDEKKTDVPSYVASEGESATRRNLFFYTQADINVVSAAYAKLRDLTVGYTLPALLSESWLLEKVRVYAQINNILLWRANNLDIDPEYINLGGGFRSLRTKPFLTLGLNVAFK